MVVGAAAARERHSVIRRKLLSTHAEPLSDDDYFDAAAAGYSYVDFEWFAADRDGRIAVLTTGGVGPVPTSVFRNRTAYFAAAAFFERLGKCGTHRLHRHRLDDVDWSSWADAADRGMFAYDCEVAGQPYWLVASPDRCLALEEVPPTVREYVSAICFDLTFGDDLFVDREFPDTNQR